MLLSIRAVAALIIIAAATIGLRTTAVAAVRAYVPLSGSNDVAVINAVSGEPIGVIRVGNKPQGIAFDPHNRTAYVTNTSDNTVSVIDTSKHQVFATVRVGLAPYGIAVTPGGSAVYVANSGDGTVSYFAALTTASTTPPLVSAVKVGGRPQGVAASPDGKYVFVTVTNNDFVSVLDTSTNTVVKSIRVGNAPVGIAAIAVPPSFAQNVLVANRLDGTVSVISVATLKVSYTVNTGLGTQMVAGFNFPAASAFVAGSYNNTGTLGVLDIPEFAMPLHKTVAQLGPNPRGIATHTDGGSVWVSEGDAVDIFDSVAYSQSDNIPLPPAGIPAVAFGQFIGPVFRATDVPALHRPRANLAIGSRGNSSTPQFVMQNLGPGPAPAVVFTTALPVGMTFYAARPSQGACVTPPLFSVAKTVTCLIGRLDPGETAMVQLAVSGPFTTTTASITSDFATDPDGSNNSISMTIGGAPNTAAAPIETPPIPTLQKTRAGVAVMNGGQARANNLMIAMTLPSGATASPAASSFGCSVTNSATGVVMRCPAQLREKAICSTDTSETCPPPARITALNGQEQAWVVFPVELSDSALLSSPVSLTISTSTPGSILPGPPRFPAVAPMLGEVASVENAEKLWGSAAKFTSNCTTDRGSDDGCTAPGAADDPLADAAAIFTGGDIPKVDPSLYPKIVKHLVNLRKHRSR